VIGPDRGSWGSNGQHISGSIFEANKGYGIWLRSSGQTKIAGNYFEANGNDIGVFTPYANTTIDTNFFWGKYGHKWHMNEYSDNAHVVLKGLERVQLRNNLYREVTAWVRRKEGTKRWEYVPRTGDEKPEQQTGYEYEERPCGILVVGKLESKGCVFDAVPVVHHNAKIIQKHVAADDGLSYFEYDEQTNQFIQKSLVGK